MREQHARRSVRGLLERHPRLLAAPARAQVADGETIRLTLDEAVRRARRSGEVPPEAVSDRPGEGDAEAAATAYLGLGNAATLRGTLGLDPVGVRARTGALQEIGGLAPATATGATGL